MTAAKWRTKGALKSVALMNISGKLPALESLPCVLLVRESAAVL